MGKLYGLTNTVRLFWQHCFMGIIILIAFWGAVYRLFWVKYDAKIPLIFIGLWLLGFAVFPMLHWNGYVFLAYEAIMAVILIIIERSRTTRKKA